MNANYFRMIISDEFRELFMWAGLAENYRDIKTKEVDSKGKTFYWHTLIYSMEHRHKVEISI